MCLCVAVVSCMMHVSADIGQKQLVLLLFVIRHDRGRKPGDDRYMLFWPLGREPPSVPTQSGRMLYDTALQSPVLVAGDAISL